MRDLPQRVLGGVAHGVVEVLVAGLRKVAQGRGVSAEVVVDLVALQGRREGAQGSEEGEVLARVLQATRPTRISTALLEVEEAKRLEVAG